MASLNKALIIGNLGKDPELRGDPPIASLSIATTEKWKDKNGEAKEETTWHRVSLFGKLAEIAGQYLKKGSQVYIEGRIQTREYEKDGVKKYSTEIVGQQMQMLGGKPAAEAPRQDKTVKPAAKAGAFDDFADDIPF